MSRNSGSCYSVFCIYFASIYSSGNQIKLTRSGGHFDKCLTTVVGGQDVQGVDPPLHLFIFYHNNILCLGEVQ